MMTEQSPLRSGTDSGDFEPSLANPNGPLHVYQRGEQKSAYPGLHGIPSRRLSIPLPSPTHTPAAWICEDAMKGYAVNENGYASHTVAEREAYIHRKRFEAYIYTPVMVLSLAMTLFEVPLW